MLLWSPVRSNSWPEISVCHRCFPKFFPTLSLFFNPGRTVINPFLLTCQKWLMSGFQNFDQQDNNNRWTLELLGCFAILVCDLENAWVVRALLTTKLHQVSTILTTLFTPFWPCQCSAVLIIYDFQMRKWHKLQPWVNDFYWVGLLLGCYVCLVEVLKENMTNNGQFVNKFWIIAKGQCSICHG